MRQVFGIVIFVSLMLATAMWTGCSKKSSESSEATPPENPPHKLVSTPAPRPYQPARPPEARALNVAAASTPCAAPAASQPQAATEPADYEPPDDTFATPQLAAARKQFGIVVIDVVAHQYTIDVQFMVQQPEKSGPILYSSPAQRYLIDQKSGTKLVPARPASARTRRDMSLRPKIGSPMGTRCYYASFDNPDDLVKPGDKVSLTIDQCRIDDLVVQHE